jgi:hypothetical protein
MCILGSSVGLLAPSYPVMREISHADRSDASLYFINPCVYLSLRMCFSIRSTGNQEYR